MERRWGVQDSKEEWKNKEGVWKDDGVWKLVRKIGRMKRVYGKMWTGDDYT